MAMFQMNNDAAQAGWGLNDELVNGCNTRLVDTQGFQLAGAKRDGADVTPLAPVVITDGGQNSDTISMYSGSALSGMGNEVLAQTYGGASEIMVSTGQPYGFAVGDVIVVAPEPKGSDCSMAQLAATPAAGKLNIAAGAGYRFNNGTLGNAEFKQGQARVYNLGSGNRISFHTWSVSNGRLLLRATDLAGTAKDPQTVIDNVVAIKAQYGFDTGVNGPFRKETMQVNQWSSSIINADGDPEVGGAGDYQHIAAIRLAVIARSGIPEKPDAKTGLCTATSEPLTVFRTNVPANVAAVPVQVNLSVAGDPVSWTCYRYRAFETIVPIRNSGWRP